MSMSEKLNPRESGSAIPQNLNEANKLLINFIVMTVCFSLNHASVTSCIALATSSGLPGNLGSYSVAVLYACYVITAMLFSQVIIFYSSQKGALTGSLAVYALYVASYLVAALVESDSVKWIAVLFGASIGGIGAGVLWTAQGAYYSENARLYAQAKGVTKEEATGYFGSIFACFYLGFEVLLKIIGSLVGLHATGEAAKYAIYILYTAIAIGSTIGMTSVRNMKAEETAGGDGVTIEKIDMTKKVLSALELLFTNAKCALMIPTNFAFGFAAAFITAYIQGSVVSPVYGDDHTDDEISDSQSQHDSRVLLYSSIAVGVATAMSMPFFYLKKKAGTPLVMVIGAVCFVFVALMSFLLEDGPLRHILWLVYIVYGCGRSIWESTTKAVFADFFPDTPQAAFANIVLQSGLASTIAFFVFPDMSPLQKEVTLGATAILGAICFLAATAIHKKEQSEEPEEGYMSVNDGPEV
eukprot:CAMPEP_0205907510 /NCGR_PEP_ID=MMETSP1325-20131115/2598_1 /ASSEMBLY_ACC=CAM_ASM_000708 /TAXON_ID=236786 /ORGANISM="Florenciella sp., Strain RCC1007" /LENGTH=468 /DNA_ID=CAMNT_0053273607 /DNA_START=55 /DNA_END=1461 /DNA_ORIENTATION=-